MEILTNTVATQSKEQVTYRPRYTANKLTLTKSQQLMYDCCIKGLSAYSPEYIKQLSYFEKNKIIDRQNETWQAINQLKQERLNNFLNITLKKLIPNICGNALSILIEPLTDRTFNPHTIRELMIPTIVIIQRLIKSNILPKDFYQL